MALKCLSFVLAIGIGGVGCAGPATQEPQVEEPAALSVTRWTDTTELFAEFPPLVVGHTSRFAIHLTRLDTFKALDTGHVDVRLTGVTPDETFTVHAPSRPGIFGVDVTPVHTGRRTLVITVRTSGLADEHRVGDVDVFADREAARRAGDAARESAAGIRFLKEQQWTLDFATALVGTGSLRETLRVPGRVEPRPDGAADVVAPIDGRLTMVASVSLGASVSEGQELARLLPPPAVPTDLPQLQRAQAEAQIHLTQATRDRERAERLTDAGAVPGRRLEEARSAEAQAQARLTAAEAALAQYNNARAGGMTNAEALFIVRAPLNGVVAERRAATGANVTAGSVLFRVVDAASVFVVGQIPEGSAVRARGATQAELEVSGRADRVRTGRRVGLGSVLDSQSRTLPVTFRFDNRTEALPLGQTVTLHLLLDTTAPHAVVPASAVVDDAGRPIVFVQREGETFERRAVTVGARTGDQVQVTEGLRAGERVVTRGAYLVRLASLSTSVPAHGHVH